MALTDHAPHNMTGASSPSPFVVSHSSCWPSYDGWHAFDGTWGATCYWIANGSTGWLAIDLGSDHTPTYYGIRANSIPEPNRCPHDWTFEGSSDGSSWNTLDTRTDESAWGNAELRYYDISSPTAYRYFRLNVTANNGDGYLVVGEVYICEGTLDPPETRVSQGPVEVALGDDTAPSARVTQGAVEVALDDDTAPAAQVTQGAVEVLISSTNDPQRVTQMVAELLLPSVASTRITQIVAEILSPVVTESRHTQLVAELLDAGARPLRVTQIVVELLGKSSTYCGEPSLSPAGLCGKPDVLAWLEWTVPMKEN